MLPSKRNSKSGTPQTSTESGSKDGEFKFPEPLPPTVLSTRESQKVIRNVAETRSLSPEDAAQQLRNFKMDSISEGRRIGGPGPPTVLEVKSSVGVRLSDYPHYICYHQIVSSAACLSAVQL